MTGVPDDGPLTAAAVDASSCPHTHRTASGRFGVAHDGQRFTDGVLAVAVLPAALLGGTTLGAAGFAVDGAAGGAIEAAGGVAAGVTARCAPDAFASAPARGAGAIAAADEDADAVAAPGILALPHSWQNFAPAGLSVPHCEQTMNRRADALLLV